MLLQIAGNKEVGRVLDQPDGRERLAAVGIEPTTASTPEQFEKFVHEEIENFTKVARAIGMRKR